jgi:hypothetical protein
MWVETLPKGSVEHGDRIALPTPTKVGVTLVHDEVKDGPIVYNKYIVYNAYLRPPQVRDRTRPPFRASTGLPVIISDYVQAHRS